jgi:hypothetical protein
MNDDRDTIAALAEFIEPDVDRFLSCVDCGWSYPIEHTAVLPHPMPGHVVIDDDDGCSNCGSKILAVRVI